MGVRVRLPSAAPTKTPRNPLSCKGSGVFFFLPNVKLVVTWSLRPEKQGFWPSNPQASADLVSRSERQKGAGLLPIYAADPAPIILFIKAKGEAAKCRRVPLPSKIRGVECISCAALCAFGLSQGQSLGHRLPRSCLRLCEGMSVNVEGSSNLGMAQRRGYRAHVCAAVDKQRGI